MTTLSKLLYIIFRALIPEPASRIHITWKNYPITIAYLVPLTILAYLVRRPNTYALRLSLLPVVVLLAIHGGFGYMWAKPELDSYNWISGEYFSLTTCYVNRKTQANRGIGFSALASSAKAVELACVKDCRRKIAEAEGNRSINTTVSNGNGHTRTVDESSTKNKQNSFLPTWLTDAIDTFTSLRGIGWEFGKDIYVPPETRSLEKVAFLKETAAQILINLIKIDIMSSLQVLVPNLGTVQGGSIFLPSLSPLPRYTLSTLIHIQTGVQALAAINTTYDILTLFGVGVLGQSPSLWPPLFDNPWISDSLHDFWGRRWHQTMRQTFLIIGGYPGRLIAGELGFVMGIFLVSGLYHEYGFYTIGRGWDNRMVLFFVFQGFGVILERLWKVVTGRRVGGLFGTLWVYFCIVGLGQSFCKYFTCINIVHKPVFIF